MLNSTLTTNCLDMQFTFTLHSQFISDVSFSIQRSSLFSCYVSYVTKCSGEGIYFAAKSGRMAAEAVVECIRKTGKLPTEKQLKQTYIKDYDKLYKPTYLVLDILQKVKRPRGSHRSRRQNQNMFDVGCKNFTCLIRSCMIVQCRIYLVGSWMIVCTRKCRLF